MNSLELQIKSLVNLFSAAGINYAILGGVAVSIYGEPRLTFDIDVNILLDKNDIDSFLGKAKKHGFHSIPLNIKDFVKKTGVLPMRFFKGKTSGRCDLIIAESPLEYSGIERARLKGIFSVKAKVISPEDLVIHKIASGRARDTEDLKGILIRQKNKLDAVYIRKWLNKLAKTSNKPKLMRLFESMLEEA